MPPLFSSSGEEDLCTCQSTRLLVGCPYTRKGFTSRGVCLRVRRSVLVFRMLSSVDTFRPSSINYLDRTVHLRSIRSHQSKNNRDLFSSSSTTRYAAIPCSVSCICWLLSGTTVYHMAKKQRTVFEQFHGKVRGDSMQCVMYLLAAERNDGIPHGENQKESSIARC